MIIQKYPRTYHLPFSPGTTSDDRIASDVSSILSGEVVFTEKLDGENTSISEFGIFARSRAAETENPWSKWLKQKFDLIKKDLKSFNIELCGENMYGEHSIIYSGLKSHLYIFGIRNLENNKFLSWEETEMYAELFDFPTVPVLFKSNKDYKITLEELKTIVLNLMNHPSCLNDNRFWITPKEGIVIRRIEEFDNNLFYNNVFKYVREKHVKTDEHWSKNWKRSFLKCELEKMDKEKILSLKH